MRYFDFHDISYAQGEYDMDSDPNPVIEMKMTGFYYGSKTPYTDVQGARNYANAIRLGKVPVIYHFAGGADPVIEADYFVDNAAMPLAEGDIYELDYELNDSMGPPADPDSWCRAFADRVYERTGVYPVLYTYTSLLQQYGFTKTLEVCGLIEANYGVSPDSTIPGPAYIIQQYTDTPLDTNASFIPLDTLKKYAYHTHPTLVTPTPVEQSAPTPAPESAPTPVQSQPTSSIDLASSGELAHNVDSNQAPLPVSTDTSKTQIDSSAAVTAPKTSIWKILIRWLAWLFK